MERGVGDGDGGCASWGTGSREKASKSKKNSNKKVDDSIVVEVRTVVLNNDGLDEERASRLYSEVESVCFRFIIVFWG